MGVFEQLMANGIVTGGMYMALALSIFLVFSVLEVAHFAQGAVAIGGGYVAYWLMSALGIPTWLTILCCIAGGVGFGLVLDQIPYRRAIQQPPVFSFIIALGLLTLLENAWQLLFGETQVVVPIAYDATIHVGPIVLTQLRLVIIVGALLVAVLTHVILQYTRMGRAIRAISSNRDAAQLMGINVTRVSGFVFAYATAIGVLVGIAYGSLFSLTPSLGSTLVLYGFAVLIVAGLGSLWGIVVASLLLGIVQNLAIGYVSSGFSSTVVFSVVIVLLAIRPFGLFSRQIRR